MSDVFVHTSRSLADLRRWYEHCRTLGKPYVFIRPRRLFSIVKMDLSAQGYVLTPEAAQEVVGLLHDRNVAPRRVVPPVSPHPDVLAYAYAGGIPKQEAVEVAERIFELAADPENRIPAAQVASDSPSGRSSPSS